MASTYDKNVVLAKGLGYQECDYLLGYGKRDYCRFLQLLL